MIEIKNRHDGTTIHRVEADTLHDANLYGANLCDANLRGADLYGADLCCANLRDANLRGAKGASLARSSPLYLLRDQPGRIRAYKLVREDGQGPYNGGITYEVGESYEVEDADVDETVSCGAGINVATMDWCLGEWQPGYKILIVSFTAKDIAAIPLGTDGKFRLHRCKVVGEKGLSEFGLIEEEEAA